LEHDPTIRLPGFLIFIPQMRQIASIS